MTQIAILLSPGHNTELETLRELIKVGLTAKIYRWNEDEHEILQAESFLIPGGFSYEDRGRSGLISAQNPIMHQVYEQVLNGKPLLGICNGAQATVEMNLLPGDQDQTKALSLAKNKRIQNNKVVGTGYYNTNSYIKLSTPQNRTPYTLLVSSEPILVPIAHGEGRYTTIYPDLPALLTQNQQIVFQYCTQDGTVIDEFPTNPNGSLLNIAALCNPQGNIVSIMPHPERGLTAPLQSMFTSLKKYLEEKPKLISFPPYKLKPINQQLQPYSNQVKNTHTVVIQEKITDNEKYTLQNTLNKLLKINIKLEKYTHYSIQCTDQNFTQLLESNELYNPNKQDIVTPKVDTNDFGLLVHYREDTEGQSIKEIANSHYKLEINEINKSTIWIFKNITPQIKEKILASNLFYNINSQEAYEYI